MQLGSYEIPEVRLKPNGLADIKLIYDAIKSSDIQANDLAKIMGYAASTSGGFYNRVKSLVLFGLLEGRGKFRVTELGKGLAYPPPDEMQRNVLLKKSVFNVELWATIFQRHGKDLTENFWYSLKEITNEEPTDIHKVESRIKNWYLEDISLVPDQLLESQDQPKKYSSQETNEKPSSQELLPNDKDGGRLILNMRGKRYNMDFDDRDSLELIVNALNIFGKNLNVEIKTENKKPNPSPDG